MKKIGIIGAGASGLLAAYGASKNGNKVTVFDSNEKAGKKIYITGKGRCNVTNNRDISEYFDFIVKNKEFLYSALYTFTNIDLISLLNENNLKTKVERGQRVFPLSDKASDVTKALLKAVSKENVEFIYNTKIKEIIVNESKAVGLKDANNEEYYFDSIILCTGGKSYPLTGSDGSGYELVRKLGHNITKLSPSLVPLVTKEKWVKDLTGLSLKNIQVSLFRNNKKIFSEFGEMLFTHEGVSGPIIISASDYFDYDNSYKITIDLKPALDYETLEKRIIKDFEKFNNKDFKNSLDELLPKKLAEKIVFLSKIPPEKKVNQITKDERKLIISLLKGLELNIVDSGSFNQAVITNGGVNVKEINSSTMESKLISNLYFAGEVIDVHAQTGGYNLQIAFSTGYLAGINC